MKTLGYKLGPIKFIGMIFYDKFGKPLIMYTKEGIYKKQKEMNWIKAIRLIREIGKEEEKI